MGVGTVADIMSGVRTDLRRPAPVPGQRDQRHRQSHLPHGILPCLILMQASLTMGDRVNLRLVRRGTGAAFGVFRSGRAGSSGLSPRCVRPYLPPMRKDPSHALLRALPHPPPRMAGRARGRGPARWTHTRLRTAGEGSADPRPRRGRSTPSQVTRTEPWPEAPIFGIALRRRGRIDHTRTRPPCPVGGGRPPRPDRDRPGLRQCADRAGAERDGDDFHGARPH